MALNSRKNKTSEYVLFDVVYDDGALSSNRKVPLSELDGGDPTGAAKAFILAQDRKIAENSGMPRGDIKTIARVKR
jgi:hypothetical protein